MNSSNSTSDEDFILQSVNHYSIRKRKRLQFFNNLIQTESHSINNNSPPINSSNLCLNQSSPLTSIQNHPQSSRQNSQSEILPSLSQLVHHPSTSTYQDVNLNIPSSPTVPAKRSLRNRKPAQLKPYTIETRKYISTLNHNGWEDAVVRFPCPVDPILNSNSPSSSMSVTDLTSQPYSSDPLDLILDHPDLSHQPIPDHSQIGQFRPRKFHRRRRHSNDPLPKRKNRPRYRRAGSEFSNRVPSRFDSKLPSVGPSRRFNHSHTNSDLHPVVQVPPSSNPHDRTTALTPVQSVHSSLSNLSSSSPSIVFASRSSPLISPSANTKPRSSSNSHRRPNKSNKYLTKNLPSKIQPGIQIHSDHQPNHNRLELDISSDSHQDDLSPVMTRQHKPKTPLRNGHRKLKHPNNSESSSMCHASGAEEEEEEEPFQPKAITRTKKVKLKILNRMMPQVYVTKAEKDLQLMEKEKRAGKLKLTIDSDSSDHNSNLSSSRRTPVKRHPSRKSSSSSISNLSEKNLNSNFNTYTEISELSHHQLRPRPSDSENSPSSQDTHALEEKEEEEEGCSRTPEILHPKKVKLKLLNRMMPRVYVTKAEKDLELMQQEKQAGKLKLTIDSDSSGPNSDLSPVPRKSPKRVPSRRLSSIPRSSEETFDTDSDRRIHTNGPPRNRSYQKAPIGMTWGDKMFMRMNRVSSSNSQLNNPHGNQFTHSHRSLERSTSHVSSVSSRISQGSSSRATRVVSQLRNKTDSSISLKDDHALWKTYESANGRPALNLPPPEYRRESRSSRNSVLIELPQVPIWTFKDFTPDFMINPLPAGLTVASQIGYLRDDHILEFIQILNGTIPYTIVESYRGFDILFSAFMSVEEWQQSLSSVADRIQDEILAWLAVDSGRSKDALLDTARWFQFLTRFISSVEFNEGLIDPMVEWTQDLINRVDDLAVDAVNRPEFSNLMLVFSWGIFELICRLDLRRRRSVSLETHQSHQTFLNLGRHSICNLLRRLLEYGPPVTMGKIKSYITDEDRDSPLFDVSVELWAALLNVILTPLEDESKLEYLAMYNFWINFEESVRLHSQKIELSQMAHGEAICYLTMMICALSQISSTGVTMPETRISSHWSVLVDSLGQLPETILSETLEVRKRERRDRYVRTLFSRILIFHERWNWELRFDDGMIEKLYKIMNGGKLERLSIEVGEMSQRFGMIDSFPTILNDIKDDEIRPMTSAEEVRFRLNTEFRQDDSCFGMFLKILVIGFKSLPRPIETSKQKEIEKIISRCNPLRQLSFKPLRELGPTDSKISDQNRTGLINHSSLFLIYSILFPNTMKRQWSFLEGLYNFSLMDHPARSTHLKILVKFVKFLKPLPISGGKQNLSHQFNYLTLAIMKFKTNFDILKAEYSKLKERQMIIQVRLTNNHDSSNSSTTAATGTINHPPISSTPKEIFKKNSTEESNLKVELAELIDLISSRIQLIVQIFKSFIDLFEYFSMDFISNDDDHHISQDDSEDRLIYPPLFWLDSSWSTGLEETGLIKEKEVMIAFNEFLWKLLETRQKKMKRTLEYCKKIKAIEERLKKKEGDADCLKALNPGIIDSETEVLKNEELVMEKNEMIEKIESIHKLDHEWIDQLNRCSVYKMIQKSVQFFIHNQPDNDFFSIGIKLIRSLGWIDQLKTRFDSKFDWLESFKSFESQMGFGITMTTITSASHQNQIQNQKCKNRLKLMTILLTSLMSYLISNLEAYRDEPSLPTQSSSPLPQSSELTSNLSRIYNGQIRFEILKVWIYSLTFLDFTIQFKFTLLILELENLKQNFSSTSCSQGVDCFKFLPDPFSFKNWLSQNGFDDNSTTGTDQLYSYHWWEFNSIELKKSTLFETKRVEFFNLIFNEMKKTLNELMNETANPNIDFTNQSRLNHDKNKTVGNNNNEKSFKNCLNFYKKIVADLSESISNLNRNLLLILNLQAQQNQLHQKSNPSVKESGQTRHDHYDLILIEKKFKRWKITIKLIIQANLGLLGSSSSSATSIGSNHIKFQAQENQQQANEILELNRATDHEFRDQDGLINLNYFFNFSTLNQLRLLKSILGLV